MRVWFSGRMSAFQAEDGSSILPTRTHRAQLFVSNHFVLRQTGCTHRVPLFSNLPAGRRVRFTHKKTGCTKSKDMCSFEHMSLLFVAGRENRGNYSFVFKGRRMVTEVPSPSFDPIPIFPPCFSTTSLVI